MGRLIFVVVVIIIASAIVPYNDDEFLQFLPLPCGFFPGNSVSNCNRFDLTLVGTYLRLPLRSYSYVGSIEALLYLPIFFLWSSPILVRLFHICLFLAGAALLARKFTVRKVDVIIALTFLFPYAFVHFSDTSGGNVVQIFFLYVIFFLIDRWISKLHWKYPIFIGLLIFLGFWQKFSFVWYVPGIVILFALSVFRHWPTVRRRPMFYWQTLSIVLIVLSLSITLLFSGSPTDPYSYPYLDALLHVDQYSTPESQMATHGYRGAIHAFFHPLDATQRIYHQFEAVLASFFYSVIVYLSVPTVLMCLLWSWRKRSCRGSLVEPIAYYCAFVVTAIFIFSISKTGGMHHSILSYPFLILSVLGTWKVIRTHYAVVPRYCKIGLYCAGIGYICINALFFLQFSVQPLRSFSHPIRSLIHTIIKQDDVADQYMIYMPDWGMYFYASLFGSHAQSILFGYYYGWTDVSTLQNLAAKNGRKLMVVFSPLQSSTETWRASMLMLDRCSAIPENAAWQILAEPSLNLTEACKKYEWVTDGGTDISKNPFVRLWLAL